MKVVNEEVVKVKEKVVAVEEDITELYKKVRG